MYHLNLVPKYYGWVPCQNTKIWVYFPILCLIFPLLSASPLAAEQQQLTSAAWINAVWQLPALLPGCFYLLNLIALYIFVKYLPLLFFLFVCFFMLSHAIISSMLSQCQLKQFVLLEVREVTNCKEKVAGKTEGCCYQNTLTLLKRNTYVAISYKHLKPLIGLDWSHHNFHPG